MQEHVGKSRHCRVVLDTLADTTFSCVGDMTEDMSRKVADTTQNVGVCAHKSTRQHPTCRAKIQRVYAKALPHLGVNWKIKNKKGM